MREGFIFDHNKCVNCKACSAACILYNDWPVEPRSILTYNGGADSLLQLINLSLACNHCESAACLEGCPSSAYRRDEMTGAVLLDRNKCLGCRYCQWNCPYDAPKFDSTDKTIAKCNLCHDSLVTNGSPACSSACPTSALTFGKLSEPRKDIPFSWFPDKNLKPAIEFASGQQSSLLIVPEADRQKSKPQQEIKSISQEISLILFSFLSVLSVTTVITAFIKGIFPDKFFVMPLLGLTGLISFMHLGQKTRSWRALSNLKHSPLSREIAAFILYIIFSAITLFFEIPFMLIVTSVAGLAFLVIIDSVYMYSDKSRSVVMHSGQTFISALLIISFLSGLMLPFVFLVIIKLISSGKNMIGKQAENYFSIRFLRLAFLILATALFFKNSYKELSSVIIFLSGELLDRILFYLDFNPLNINTSISEHRNNEKNEERS